MEKIKTINYNGKEIKCIESLDYKVISLLLVSLLVVPVTLLFLKQYLVAAIIHFLTLFGLIIGGRNLFMNYEPIKV